MSESFYESWKNAEVYLKAMTDILKITEYDGYKFSTGDENMYEEFFKFIHDNQSTNKIINTRLIETFNSLIDHFDTKYDHNEIDIRLYIIDYLTTNCFNYRDYACYTHFNVIRNLHKYFDYTSSVYYQCMEILIYNNCPNDIFKLYCNNLTYDSNNSIMISELISKTLIYDQFENYNTLIEMAKSNNLPYTIILKKYIIDNINTYEWRKWDDAECTMRKFLISYEQNKIKYNITDDLINFCK